MWAIGDWRTVGLFVSIASVMSISWCANGSWAQESGAGAVDSVQREKQLRDQMQTILNELEELQKAKPATPAAEIPAAPVVKERETTAQVQEDGARELEKVTRVSPLPVMVLPVRWLPPVVMTTAAGPQSGLTQPDASKELSATVTPGHAPGVASS